MRRLIVNPDTGNAWEIPLQPGVVSIGRNPENNVPLEHDSISGEHCLLTATDSGVVVKDLGSANGTFINGERVDEKPLLPGQTLRLGDVLLRLEAKAAAPAEVPATGKSSPTTVFCRTHIKAIARFHCPRCQRHFCDACVSMRQGRTFCRACSVECETLAPVERSDEMVPSFFALAKGAFHYPLKGDGLVLLASGTVLLALVDAAKFVLRFIPGYGWVLILALTVFGGGYLTAYLRAILAGTAAGEEKMPDWPEFTDFGSLAAPFFQLIGTVIFSFGLAIGLTIYAAFASEGGPWLGWATTAAIVFGCLYFPMAFMAVAMFDSVGAVNPLLIIPTILKIPLEYSITVALFAVILFVRWLGNTLLPAVLPIPLFPSVLSYFMGLYFLTVEMRILGLLYWTKRHELGWFRH